MVDERLRQLYWEAIERLPPQCQAAFKLAVTQRLPYRETAKQLGISPARVERHVALGLLKVHSYLSKHERPTLQ